MTVEELASISGLKEKTIRKNILKVKGARFSDNGRVFIPEGSRYPYSLHRYKLDSIDKRRIALLDATNRFRFVDHNDLKMSKKSFVTMLNELLDQGFLQENGSNNLFGANRYDTTLLYQQNKAEIKKMNLNTITSAAGHFLGAIINETLI